MKNEYTGWPKTHQFWISFTARTVTDSELTGFEWPYLGSISAFLVILGLWGIIWGRFKTKKKRKYVCSFIFYTSFSCVNRLCEAVPERDKLVEDRSMKDWTAKWNTLNVTWVQELSKTDCWKKSSSNHRHCLHRYLLGIIFPLGRSCAAISYRCLACGQSARVVGKGTVCRLWSWIHFRYCRQRQKNRALFFLEMWHLLVPLKFLLLWDVYMQSDMPLV